MDKLKENGKWYIFSLIWTVVSITALSACSNNDNASPTDNISAIADKVWTFSQSHPDGFTLDIRTMTEPTARFGNCTRNTD